MSDALRTFIRQTRLRGKHSEPPDTDAQERLVARIAAWLALAHTHGVEQAQQDVARAISLSKPRNWFDKARQVVASLVASITETVEGWISDATDGQADISEADIADMVTQELEAFAENKADLISTWEIPAAFENGLLETFIEMGVLTKQVVNQENPCPVCLANAEQGSIPINEPFQSGDDTAPFHGRCRCQVVPGDDTSVSRVAQPSHRVSKMGTCTCEICQGMHGKTIQDTQPPYHDGCSCESVEASV